MFLISALPLASGSSHAARACVISAMLGSGARASVSIRQGGALTSYAGLGAHHGRHSEAQARADPDTVLTAKTVRVVPIRLAVGVDEDLSDKERVLAANRVDRTPGHGLARSLEVVCPNDAPDLSVRTTITHFGRPAQPPLARRQLRGS